MDLITFSFSKNYIWSGLSVAALGLLTYLTNRYMKNTVDTSNQIYYKTNEKISGIANLNYLKEKDSKEKNVKVNYIFWNGDLGSTYLIINHLMQDQIVQPIYIERYSIIKYLEEDNLNNILKKKQINKPLSPEDKILLKEISNVKQIQNKESKDLEIMRQMILKHYPEFKFNFLPTLYVSNIQKDLSHTSTFYDNIKNISPIHSNGIELIELINRFIKYNFPDENESLPSQKNILIAYTNQYKNIDLLKKLIDKGYLKNVKLPFINIDNETVRYMSVEFLPNSIIIGFLNNNKK
jgi:hypothetical protein